MPNVNLDQIVNSDKWVVDARTGVIIGVQSGSIFSQFASTVNNALTMAEWLTLAGTPAVLTNPTFQATNSVNNYTQISIQNKSAGVNASADLIAYPDNVTASDLTGFADVGITSSGFSQAAYAITGPNEAYLFGSAPSGSGTTGNLIIATDSTGTTNAIKFATGGFQTVANIRVNMDATGLSIVQAGAGIRIKEGANAKMGLTAALVAGVLVVANTSVTATSRIFVQRQTDGGTVAASYSITRSAGVSFTITARDGTGAAQTADTSTLAFQILEPSA